LKNGIISNPEPDHIKNNFVDPKKGFGLSKIDLSILLANILDHYSASIYLFLAPFFAIYYLGSLDKNLAVMIAYGFILSSIIAKPIGSLFFGKISKNLSPETSLKYSLIGLGFCNIIVFFLPSKELIGFWAAIFLFVAKFLISFFSGGESSIAKIYILENKSESDSIKSSYLYPFSSSVGTILASITSIFFTHNFREIYLVTGISILLISLVRLKIISRTINSKEINIKTEKISQILIKHIYKVFLIFFTCSVSYITWYVPFVLTNIILESSSQISFKKLMFYNSILMCLDLLLIPIIGRFYKQKNIKKIMLFSLSVILFSIFFGFTNIKSLNIFQVTIFKMSIIIFGIMFFCPQHYLYNKIFSKNSNEKFLIIGISTSLASAIIGKVLPFLSLFIIHNFGNLTYLAIFFATIIVASFIFILNAKIL
jgi:MFS family permease